MTSIYDMRRTEFAPKSGFLDVALGRRTIREISSLDLDETFALVREVMQVRQLGIERNSGRARKVSLSAGALQSIEVLIVSGPGVELPILYCDTHDVFGTIEVENAERFNEALTPLRAVLPDASGHFLLLVANVRHAEQSYENPITLLWRDAGAVLQSFSLFAAAYGCGFAPLGPTGADLLSRLKQPHSNYLAVGTAIIGRKRSPAAHESD